MLSTIVILLLVLILIIVLRSAFTPMIHDEVYATETIEETEPEYNIVGSLKRETENEQAFVIDPVDKKKMWINSNDDMYEDADGKIWRLS